MNNRTIETNEITMAIFGMKRMRRRFKAGLVSDPTMMAVNKVMIPAESPITKNDNVMMDGV